ncbi:histidine kinase [Plantactinospora sp. B24E8]|uniref:sensor histidine kinase n=1 Tax=Plantactinospora sp. B24E8 TaxID=3153567 RepID=UPI00325C7846
MRRHLGSSWDVLLWLPFALLVVSGWSGHRAYPVGLLVAGLTLWGGAVWLSRRLPLVSLFVVVGLCALDGNYSFALPVVSYLLGRRMAPIWPAAVGYPVLAALGTVVVLSRYDFVTWAIQAGALIYAGLFPWLLGRYRRQQAELTAAGWEQAEQLERAQRSLVAEVRLRERARIAEEMHDSLGHELSLLALRAGALELDAGLDERSRASAGQLRLGAAAATAQLRDIITVLRDDDTSGRTDDGTTQDGPTDNGPTQDAAGRADGESIEALVRRAGAAGTPVRLRAPAGPAPLPGLVRRTAYRIVREALTNANKHAPGAPVEVRLDRADNTGMLLVSVVNERPSPGSVGHRPGGGRGLVGLRERVRLIGGTLHTDERDGGFAVVARLPLAPTWSPDPARSDGPTTPAADRRRLAHREARRGLVVASLVLTTLAVSLGGPALGYYLYVTGGSVLSPQRYAVLVVGQEWASVEPLLPRRETLDRPDPDPLPTPPGAGCRYYRAHGDVLQPRVDVYRLCTADGRLVAKDVLPDSEPSARPMPE